MKIEEEPDPDVPDPDVPDYLPWKDPKHPGYRATGVNDELIEHYRRFIADYSIAASPLADGYNAVVTQCVHRASKRMYAARITRVTWRWTPYNQSERHKMILLGSQMSIPLIDTYVGRCGAVYVYPLYRGGDLFDYFNKHGQLSDAEIREVAKQIGRQLHRLHTQNMAHGDVKGENILIEKPYIPFHQNTLSLTDYEFMRAAGSRDDFVHRNGGTEHYRPKESADMNNVSMWRMCAIDMYALGVTLYTMVTGQVHHPKHYPYVFDDNITVAGQKALIGLLNPSDTKRWTSQDLLDSEWITKEVTWR